MKHVVRITEILVWLLVLTCFGILLNKVHYHHTLYERNYVRGKVEYDSFFDGNLVYHAGIAADGSPVCGILVDEAAGISMGGIGCESASRYIDLRARAIGSPRFTYYNVHQEFAFGVGSNHSWGMDMLDKGDNK